MTSLMKCFGHWTRTTSYLVVAAAILLGAGLANCRAVHAADANAILKFDWKGKDAIFWVVTDGGGRSVSSQIALAGQESTVSLPPGMYDVRIRFITGGGTSGPGESLYLVGRTSLVAGRTTVVAPPVGRLRVEYKGKGGLVLWELLDANRRLVSHGFLASSPGTTIDVPAGSFVVEISTPQPQFVPVTIRAGQTTNVIR